MVLLGDFNAKIKRGSLMTNHQAKEPNWNPLLRYMGPQTQIMFQKTHQVSFQSVLSFLDVLQGHIQENTFLYTFCVLGIDQFFSSLLFLKFIPEGDEGEG